MTRRKPIFILSAFDYGFLNQRPRELARELVRLGYKIVFIDPQRLGPGRLNPRTRLTSISKNFWHLHPVITRSASKNKKILARTIRDFARRQGFKAYNLWLSSPFDYAAVIDSGADKVLYECLDDTVFDQKTFGRLQTALLARCDVLIKSSPFLLPEHPGFISNQGVDCEHFRPKKVFGFFGLIGPWIDFRLLRQLARRRPDAEVRLIGPVSAPVPRLPDNVMLMGPRPYKDLPFLVRAFDVCLIPNKLRDRRMARFLMGRHPLKAYEYLAAGKPVVATALPSLKKWSHLIYLTQTPAEFVAACARALTEHSPVRQQARQKAMCAESWAARARELDAHFKECGY